MSEVQQEQTPPAEEKPKKGEVIVRDVTPTGAATKGKDLNLFRSFLLIATELDGTERVGTFTVKRLTIGEIARTGVIRGQLNSGIAEDVLDVDVLKLHEWMAFTSVSVVEKPDWFKPAEMFCSTVLKRVYEEGRAFIDSFRK